MTGTHQGYKFLSRSARTNLPWPVGPARVGSLGGVVKCDYHCREFDSEFDHTDLTKLAALLEALWLRDDNLICEVASRAKDSLQSKMRTSRVLWKRPARLRSQSSQ